MIWVKNYMYRNCQILLVVKSLLGVSVWGYPLKKDSLEKF